LGNNAIIVYAAQSDELVINIYELKLDNDLKLENAGHSNAPFDDKISD